MLRRLAFLALVVPAAAAAQQRTVVVPDVAATGLVDDAARAAFAAAVQEGVEASGATLVAPKTLSAALAEQPDLGRCDENDRCLLTLARATRAQAVVIAQVHKEAVRGERERAQYTARLRLFDAQAAEFTSVQEQTCGRCTEPELQTLLRETTKRLFAEERHLPTTPLEVKSTPPEAEVTFDGRLIGLTNLDQSVAAGAHRLTVEKRGLQPAAVELSLVPQKRWRVAVSWDRAGAPQVEQGEPSVLDQAHLNPTPPERPDRRLRLILGIAGGAAGLVLSAIGISLFAIDGRGTCETADTMRCPERYSTAAGGWVSVITGVAAVGVGIGLLVTALRAR